MEDWVKSSPMGCPQHYDNLCQTLHAVYSFCWLISFQGHRRVWINMLSFPVENVCLWTICLSCLGCSCVIMCVGCLLSWTALPGTVSAWDYSGCVQTSHLDALLLSFHCGWGIHPHCLHSGYCGKHTFVLVDPFSSADVAVHFICLVTLLLFMMLLLIVTRMHFEKVWAA